MLADMLREYRLTESDVAQLSLRRLRYLLSGLSEGSSFRAAVARDAKTVTNAQAIEILGG